MKKIYLTLTVALATVTMNAQLTLTQAAYAPVAGEIELKSYLDSTTALPRNTGANQSWNFSSLSHTNTSVDSTRYMSPSNTPSASLFPGATLVSLEGNTYTYYKSNASQIENLGYYTTGGTVVNYTNTEIQAVWPIAFSNTQSDAYSGPITGPDTGVEYGSFTLTASGSGTVIMPGGQQITNVLQVVTKIAGTQTSTSTFISSLTVSGTKYDYYKAGEKSAFLTVTDGVISTNLGTSPLNTITTATTISSAPTGIREQSNDLSWAVFPNPANEQISIKLANAGNEPCIIRLYNTLGALVKQATAKNSADTNLQINVSDLSPGIYFVNATQGNKTALKKIVIE